MLSLGTAATAALSRSPLPLAALVEMDLSSPVFLNTGSLDLSIGSATYYGTRGLGSIGSVQDSPQEVKPLEFTLAGVSATLLALALAEPIQGKPVRLKLAIFDPDSYAVLETVLLWTGMLDVMAIEDDASGRTCSIRVTAEHGGIDLIRPNVSLYTDSEQQRLYPGDPSLQYMADQVDMRIVWPAASWGRK